MSAEVYQGRRTESGCEILADGEPLNLMVSLKVWNHSPTGFEWGYSGSGPAQSALAILLDYTHKRDFSERFHHVFKEEFLSVAPKRGWVISASKIDDFIERVKLMEAVLHRKLCDKCLCEDAMHSGEKCFTKGCVCP